MIELLIVVALATLGLYFTTTTPESMERGPVEDDHYEDESQEDEGGIGILGIDVGRKMKHIRRARTAARERVAMLRRNAAPAAPAPQPESAPEQTDQAIRSILTGAEWDDDGASTAPAGTDSYDDEAEDDRLSPIVPRSIRRPEAAAPAEGEAVSEASDGAGAVASEAQAEDAGAPERREPVAEAEVELAEDEGQDGPVAEDAGGDEESAFDAAISAAIRAELAEQEAYRAAAGTAPSWQQDPSGPPVIEDFDPDEDQIVIGYHPADAGDGRIGITEDPTWPGTARVTLGGKVVALVPGGYGLVQTYHIQLRLLDDAA